MFAKYLSQRDMSDILITVCFMNTRLDDPVQVIRFFLFIYVHNDMSLQFTDPIN